MAWKSAYERTVEGLAAGERLRQKRLDAAYRPPPDPFEPEFRYVGGGQMSGQQEAPRHKDAYTRAVEALEEMDRRRLARENGEPVPTGTMETAQLLAARLVDPNRPQPKPWRDPRIEPSLHVLANRVMGRPDDFGDDTADSADDH